jgi:hypothetical protein
LDARFASRHPVPAVPTSVEGVPVNPLVLDGQMQVLGKCQYWRERMDEDDRWDVGVKYQTKRVRCSCFIEGTLWDRMVSTLPGDCPDASTCRYHVRSW